MNRKTYAGFKFPDGRKEVKVIAMLEGRPLYEVPLKHIVRHSPTGFEWGYGGSGPADLALSILTNAFGKAIAEKYYQKFKVIVASLDDNWSLDIEDIKDFLKNEGAVFE